MLDSKIAIGDGNLNTVKNTDHVALNIELNQHLKPIANAYTGLNKETP